MLKGKAIMIGVMIGGSYRTIAFANSHTLEMSAQTGDISTKDHNDKGVSSTVTGIGWSISTDNLMEDNDTLVACGFKTLKEVITAGLPISVHVKYFSESIGADSLGKSNNWYAVDADNSAETIIGGQVLVTSLNLNAPNKENASYSATFTGKGAFTVG